MSLRLQNNELTQMEREAFEVPEVVAEQLGNYENIINNILIAIKEQQVNGVVICGRGSSNNAAVFAKYLIEVYVGLTCSLSAPSVNSIYGANQNLEGKLFLVISQSGRSLDLIAAAEGAKKNGALVISLVNDEESPLAALGHFCIPMLAGPETSVAATKTFVASLSALLMLVAKWSGDTELVNSLPKLPKYLQSCLNVDWTSAISQLLQVQNVYMLGRGFGLAIAKEAALKFKETAHIFAEDYSIAEFMHGPLTTVSKGHQLMVFVPQDETFDGNSQAIDKLYKMGASILVVSAAKTLKGTVLAIPVAPHSVCEPLGMIAAFYSMAAKLSIARGINPDVPPHISKVTLTV